MNWATKIMDRQLGHNPFSTGRAEPLTSSTETMHAIVWHGKQDVRYELVPKPLITAPHDVIVKTTATTICGSDLHIYNAEITGFEEGDIIGHECVGFIVDKGSDVHLELGTRVVVSSIIACGNCEFCKREEYTSCDTTNPSRVAEKMFGHPASGILGCGHLLGGYWGCQAEFVRVPFGDMNCLPIPDDVPDEKAIFLSDVMCTAYHACEMGEVKKGDIVGIWGLGPIGLAVARWCQILGCSKVIGVDCTEDRLDLAGKLGISVINYKEQDTVKTMAELAGPMGLDVAIEAAGFRFAKGWLHKIERALMLESDTPEIITECCLATRKNGHVSVIGDYIGCCNNFPIGMIQLKHLTLRAGLVPLQAVWKMALDKVVSGEYDPTFMITHRKTMAEFPDAYKTFNNREDGMIKIFARP